MAHHLVYLGAPERRFTDRAEWDPPVPMSTVLSQIDQAENARADFEWGVVRITAHEYETALAVASYR